VFELGSSAPGVGRRGRLAAGLRRVAGRRPVTLVSALLVCLALAAAGITVVQFGNKSADDADTRLSRHAEGIAGDLSRAFSDASRDLRLARLNSTYDIVLGSTQGAIGQQERALIENSITYVGDRYHVDEICLIRSNGVETARWNGGTVAPVSNLSPDESGNPFFKPAIGLPSDSVFITEPYVSPDSHRWVYGFATPIVLTSGVRAGVLHFEIPVQRLADVIASNPFGTGSYTVVVDRSGRALVAPDIDLSGVVAESSASYPVSAAMASLTGRSVIDGAVADDTGTGRLATFEDADGPSRVSAWPVAGTDLVVMSVSPLSELYADVDRSRFNLLITVGPLVLLMVMVSAWFASRLAGTNRRLAFTGRASSQLASIVESADDAILSVEADGRIATWNAGAQAMYGRTQEDVIGQRLDVLFADGYGDELPSLLESVLAGDRVERFETVHKVLDGSRIDVWLTLSPISSGGSIVGASVIARDIRDRKRLEEELAHQALHDSLTGLPNRVLFRDRLRQSLHGHPDLKRAATGRHAVLFVDLDNFKVINDTLGHQAGDELLVAVAARLRDTLRGSDTAARLGGDEFTILLANIDSGSQASAAADRILDELRRPFDLGGHEVVVSASIGIAFGEAGADDPDDLLRAADTALYEAKGHGKGRHETYQQTMNVRAWRRLEVENELRLAIARGDLRVHYQPIVDLETGRPGEVEALVRWQHAVRGLIPPVDFIELAEQTGLIIPIGEFVLAAACRQLVEWQKRSGAAADLRVAVNVSPRELVRRGYVENVIAVLEGNGLASSSLRLEITEGAILEGENAVIALRALRAHGVRVSVDDFGTGYSSLGYFSELHVDGLKIDRAFVDGLGIEREDTAIVTAAIAFGRALEVEVTGEGIETTDQVARLLELGCRLGQGYLFSRPVPAAELNAFLASAGGRSDAA
jgi:diguanylate cyclase (GGDEF)-like protein/PAS domain S-box-containing protein